jgi:hypothetical protein
MKKSKPTAGERMIASAKQAFAFAKGEDNGCAVFHRSHAPRGIASKDALRQV